jgi:hypothetical protein
MRKKINLTAFVTTGAAALFVGLAGNMHAIPISMHNDSDAGMWSWNNAGEPRNLGSRYFNHHRHGVTTTLPSLTGLDPVSPTLPPLTGLDLVSTTSPPLTGQEPNDSSTSVPDGGTTAMMMAGAFCGLALVRKTLKV